MVKRDREVQHGGDVRPNRNPGINIMITSLKRVILLCFVTTLLSVAGTDYNTALGFAKDVEVAGGKLQDGTD